MQGGVFFWTLQLSQLQWIICKIDPELGEFRNSRNNTSILFNKEMVVKALGLPQGNRPVVLTPPHADSPYREFYKIKYDHGMRAPIHHAIKLLKTDLDDETWLRTFYLVVVATYLCPGTGNMLPLEYLGSLDDPSIVHEYDWGEHIFKHTMCGIKDFLAKKKKAETEGNTCFESWVCGCLPWVAIVYMDHLHLPVSTLSSHRINYALPRASHVSVEDFKYVIKHDKNILTLKPHIFGVRPLRPFRDTPYATVNSSVGNIATQGHMEAQPAAAISSHLGTELPDYMKAIFEKHTSLWLRDVQRHTTRLTKLHSKRMSEFASDVVASMKSRGTVPHVLLSPPRSVSSPASSSVTPPDLR